MKPRTKTLIKLIVFAVIVLVAVDFVQRVKQARDAARRSQYHAQLSLAWNVVVKYQDDNHLIPPAVTIFKNSNGEELQQSWRILAYTDAPSYQDEMAWAEMYRFDEPWDSIDNTNVAQTAVDDVYNYFGATYGGGHDAAPTYAGILVVTGPGGAWLKDGTQTKKELMAKGDKIAMVYLPDSKIKLFEPKDITFQELVKLVKEKGKAHAFTAQGEFRVLDEAWADQAEQDMTPHGSH